jgi:hypothetical protein
MNAKSKNGLSKYWSAKLARYGIKNANFKIAQAKKGITINGKSIDEKDMGWARKLLSIKTGTKVAKPTATSSKASKAVRKDGGMTKREFKEKYGSEIFKKHNKRYYAGKSLIKKEDELLAKQLLARQIRRGEAEQKHVEILARREQRAKDRAERLLARAFKKEDTAERRAKLRQEREDRKVQRQLAREAKVQARAYASELKLAVREVDRRQKMQDRAKLSFRVIGKAWARTKAYKPYRLWYHGELPTETKPMLNALKTFLSKRPRLKVTTSKLAIVDGYLVAKPLDARSRAAVENFVTAYLLGTGFYFVK